MTSNLVSRNRLIGTSAQPLRPAHPRDEIGYWRDDLSDNALFADAKTAGGVRQTLQIRPRNGQVRR